MLDSLPLLLVPATQCLRHSHEKYPLWPSVPGSPLLARLGVLETEGPNLDLWKYSRNIYFCFSSCLSGITRHKDMAVAGVFRHQGESGFGRQAVCRRQLANISLFVLKNVHIHVACGQEGALTSWRGMMHFSHSMLRAGCPQCFSHGLRL